MIVFGGAVLLGGCGSGGGVSKAHALAYARAVNLREVDMELQASSRHPGGEIPLSTTYEVGVNSWIGACEPVPEGSTQATRRVVAVESPLFGAELGEEGKGEEEVEVRSEVWVWPSVSVAEEKAQAPSASDLACMTRTFDHERAYGNCHAERRLPPGTPPSEGIVGARMTCLYTKPPRGGWPDIRYDWFNFRVGQAVVWMTVIGGRDVSAAGEHEILAALYSRAKSAKL